MMIMNVALPHAPLRNGGLGNRFVAYMYFGPLVTQPSTLRLDGATSILPNSPAEVSTCIALRN